MGFLKNLFIKKDAPIKTYQDFWAWFQQNEKAFFKIVKEKGDLEKGFFDKLSPRLLSLKEGFFYLTGMLNENTVELIFTADGTIHNIVFVEELVAAAPQIAGWQFTALKPASDIKNTSIEMAGNRFTAENLRFYANDFPEFPDEIDITVVHDDLTTKNKNNITTGVYIFLDNFLGELNFVTTIDNLTVVGKNDVKKELIPVERLKPFLIWREKEFIEKYEGARHHTENDNYQMLEAELSAGNSLVAVINTDLLHWNGKASHPWILNIELKYDGSKTNGMPDQNTYNLLLTIEEEILSELKDFQGYLNVGRQTANGVREIYFACKDFRKPSKVSWQIKQKYITEIEMEYEIYKDKYWQSFNRFLNDV